jgi:FAD synthase
VLGWDPRLPLVAPCDRGRVLSTWKKACLGSVPKEHIIPFSEVRKMSPEEFVDLLDVDLGVKGVVVGSNYRFGYKAAGTAEVLKSLGAERGIQVKIVNLIEKDSIDSHGLGEVVSSSKIRDGLKEGDMTVVEQCLGRKYRLVATVRKDDLTAHRKSSCDLFLNQYPKYGEYTVSVSFADVNTLQVLSEPVTTSMSLDEDGFSFEALKSNALDAFNNGTYYCFIDF